jgi:AraC family transcriptional regulator of adaptative response/methylated-DNA-[protein]-cysteine methyltransferase
LSLGGDGIRAILMGDSRDTLCGDLAARSPYKRLIADEAGLNDVVRKVVAFIDASHGGLEVPQDIKGTAFERRAWRALRDIPAGSTSNYGVIAKALGSPATAQEVAAACAANSQAAAIPCHWVLKADGSISGYRWGVARERALLAREVRAA